MRTLYIGKTWPEPASTAAGRRTLDIVQTLTELGEVHFASAARPTEFSVALTEQGIVSHQVQLNDDGFDDWLASLQPDCVVFERFMTEEQFGWRVSTTCPQALRVLDTSDLHSLREARHQQVLQLDRGLTSALDLYSDTALRELAAIMRCDLTLMISHVETELLQSTFSVSSELLHTVPFMLSPLPDFDALPEFDQRQHLILLGNYRHAPNRDAAMTLRQHWPQWRSRFPQGTELHVLGAYVDHAIQALHRPQIGFRVMGRAQDALYTLRQYRLNLGWLRFGAGIKGKVADAWLSGTPTVATAIAAEGMHPGQDWGSAIEDDPDRWWQEVLRLYTDREAWQQAQRQGWHIAETCHNTVQHQSDLRHRLEGLYQNLEAHRHRHFWGRLLQQQQFRASEYFSRWITAKNQ